MSENHVNKLIKEQDEGYLKGHVRIVLNKDSKRPIVWYDDHNVVVDTGRIRDAKLRSGEATDVVDAMIIGNGGASPPNNISPTAPSRSDTALLGRITDTDATQTVSIVRSLSTVRYDATFSSDDVSHSDYPLFGSLGLDAVYVNELGLILTTTTPADELFARVTFAPISFQNGSSTSISVQWSITTL